MVQNQRIFLKMKRKIKKMKIEELEVQVFFWILYGVSVLTFFMALLCGYIYYVFRKKTGPLGPQGFQGEPGEMGDPGTCDQNLCRGRTLAILIGKLIEKAELLPLSLKQVKRDVVIKKVNFGKNVK